MPGRGQPFPPDRASACLLIGSIGTERNLSVLPEGSGTLPDLPGNIAPPPRREERNDHRARDGETAARVV